MEPAPLPCRGSLSFLNHFYTPSFSWDMAPFHRGENLHTPKVSEPGSGRAGRGTQKTGPDKGLPYEGVGHPLSPRGRLTLLPFLMSEVAQRVQGWVGAWGPVIEDGLIAPAAGGIGRDRVLSSPSLKQVPAS